MSFNIQGTKTGACYQIFLRTPAVNYPYHKVPVNLELTEKTPKKIAEAFGEAYLAAVNFVIDREKGMRAQLGEYLSKSVQGVDNTPLDQNFLLQQDVRSDCTPGSFLWALSQIVSSQVFFFSGGLVTVQIRLQFSNEHSHLARKSNMNQRDVDITQMFDLGVPTDISVEDKVKYLLVEGQEMLNAFGEKHGVLAFRNLMSNVEPNVFRYLYDNPGLLDTWAVKMGFSDSNSALDHIEAQLLQTGDQIDAEEEDILNFVPPEEYS